MLHPCFLDLHHRSRFRDAASIEVELQQLPKRWRPQVKPGGSGPVEDVSNTVDVIKKKRIATLQLSCCSVQRNAS